MSKWLVLFTVVVSLTGCMYRPDLSQGDSISQVELDNLKTGLTKSQVQQIMGTPALNPVLETEQWSYTYAYLDGKHRDKNLDFQTIVLYFKNGKLESYSSQHWHPTHLPKRKS